jgi:flagellar hook-associated protein 2
VANSSIDGLVSGLDTTTIIAQLMGLERAPQDRLRTQKTNLSNEIAIYQALNTKFSALASKAQDLARVAGWRAMKATSSSTAVTATATSNAPAGQLSFTVQQLSRAGAVASTGTVTSAAAIVASGPVVLARGADRIGLSAVGAGAGLTTGAHTIAVTQATTGAAATGTGALAASTTFGADVTLDVTVDGVAKTYTIAAGTYTQAQLADTVTTASGGDLSATLDGAGVLTLTTRHEGSTASLAITGGSAAASLALTTGGPATTGTDGLLTVDGGSVVTINSAGPGVTVSLTGPKGTIDATFASGLRVGTATVANVDPGGGSLTALVDAVNAANAGFSAAAVKVGTAGYRLQITSTATGADTNVTVDTTNLGGGLAGFATVQAGQDAVIRIGQGPGAYDVSSATDSIKDLLPGVSVQLNTADPTATVTLTVAQDGTALADKLSALVDAANGALAAIKTNSSYDPETKKAGLLLADGNARRLSDRILNAVSSAVAGNSLGSAGAVGVSLVRDGTISFDRNKFLAAYAADPVAVAALFQEGGTASDSHVSYLAGSDKTRAGTYAVDVTQVAAQASAAGTALSGAGLVASETIEVRVGGASGKTATYAAALGESLDSVADGLNAAFAQQSLAISAAVVAGTLVLRSSDYGSKAAFEVRSSALGAAGEQTGLVAATGVWENHAGVDVAGTINGVTATGNGQVLISPATDSTLAGLALTITATAPGALGTFTYIPGVAARLDAAASEAIDFGTGSITTAISGRRQRMSEIDTRISDWDVRLASREATMRRQFAAMETALGKLRDQSNWLAGQLASLPTSSSSSS